MTRREWTTVAALAIPLAIGYWIVIAVLMYAAKAGIDALPKPLADIVGLALGFPFIWIVGLLRIGGNLSTILALFLNGLLWGAAIATAFVYLWKKTRRSKTDG